MSEITKTKFSANQLLFKEIVLGTLIYVLVLGLFNDYTNIVFAKSFSYIIYVSIVLEVLTYLVMIGKHKIVTWLKDKPGKAYRALMFFTIWLLLFLSKFIFIWTIDLIFRKYVYVKGFFGILIVVICVTIIHKLFDYIFIKLGDD